jgi:hypothetical protein
MADDHVGCGEDEVEESRLPARLAARFDRAVALAADEQARSLALREIADGLLERRLRVRACAWCESISLGAGWHRTSSGRLVGELSRNAAATHGICPACFAAFLPGVPYPID